MIVLRYFKKKKVNEGDNEAAEQQNQQAQSIIVDSNKKIADIEEKIADIRSAADAQINDLKKQITSEQDKIAKAGGSVNPSAVIEHKKSFGRKLYEASTNRTDEMFTMISVAFDSIQDLSYTPNDTKKKTMARNLIAFINKNVSWGSDGEYHGDEFNDEVKRSINAGQMSLSIKEKEKFVEELDKQLKDNVMFSYIFKEKENN